MRQTWAAWCLSLALAGAATLGTSAPAWAQMETREGIALQNEILDLRHQLEVMRAQIASGGGGYGTAPVPVVPRSPPPVAGDITAQLLDRVSMLEEQVRQLRGRSDELANTMQQMNADLSKQIADLSFQLQAGAGGAKGAAAAPPLPSGNLAAGLTPPPPGAAAGPLHRTPEMTLQDGNAALARRDYPAAEAAAKEVLATRGPRSGDAQFLYAQALAGERNYPAAAVAYNDSYERSHNGSHAADSLLGLANALAALGDNAAACGALNKLRTDVPNPRTDLAGPIAAARTRAQCR